MNMWTNFQYGGQPMFGSLGRRTSANSALHYRDASIEDVLASKNPQSHNPDEPNNDRITSRQAMMFGSLSPGQQMMFDIGSGMLANSREPPGIAAGKSLQYAQQNAGDRARTGLLFEEGERKRSAWQEDQRTARTQ